MKFKKFLLLFGKTLKSMSQKEEIIALLFVIVIILSGYNIFKNKNTHPVSIQKNGENVPLEGGAYSEGLIGRIKRLNPLFTEFNSTDRDISSLIFSGLSKYDPITSEVVEDIATHTLSVDKLTYIFTVKNNVFWHDGTPVTANDVYFTYHDIIQSENFENPILKSNFEGIEIEQVDEKTVTFTLNSINSFFFTNTTIGLLPQHLLANVDISELDTIEFNQMPIGSGAYMITEPVKNMEKEENQVNLTIFPDYYGEKPHIKDIRFFTFQDEESLYKAKNSLNGLSKITKKEEVEELNQSGRFQLFPYSLPQYTALFLNTESHILKESKVRLGLSKSINKEELIKQLEYKKRIDTPLLELNQANWLNKPSEDEAKGALYDAGWLYDEEDREKKGYRKNENGEELQLRLIAHQFSNNEARKNETEKTINFVKKAWEDIGVKIIVEIYENETFQEKVKNNDYDVLLGGQGIGYNLDTYSFWHSSQGGGAGLNLSNYKNPIADNLIEAIRSTFNPEMKQSKLQKLAETIQSDVPAIFLYSPIYYIVIDTRIKNVEIGNLAFPADRLTNLPKWYIKERTLRETE